MDATAMPLHERGLGNVLGTSPAMQTMFELIQRGAPTEATVLLMGESGVGKELVAEVIHQLSGRANGPLIAINCASIPATLIEAELFGYEKGSFTGASRSHAGVFERADRWHAVSGRNHRDAARDADAAAARAGDRALLSRRRHAGDQAPISASSRPPTAIFRTRCATDGCAKTCCTGWRCSRSACRRCATGPDDCELLADHFLAELNSRTRSRTSASRTAHARCCVSIDWPGNVRELRNAVERAFIMSDIGARACADDPSATRFVDE